MASSPVLRADDVTECPICTEVLTDPRVLACIHTYCMKCIEDYCRDKQPGEQMACPMCRQLFTIPVDGVSALPANNFIAKMLNAQKVSVASIIKCDMCDTADENKQDDEAGGRVKLFCIECQSKMCERCETFHRKIPSCRNHSTVPIESQQNITATLTKHSTNLCNKHVDRKLEIYCHNCKVVACLTCYASEHNSHKMSDVAVVGEEFREQMTKDVIGLAEHVEQCNNELQGVSKNREDFIAEIARAENLVCLEAEEEKEMVERRKQIMIDELTIFKNKRLKEIDSLHDAIDLHMNVVVSMEKYMGKLAANGTSADISAESFALHEKYTAHTNNTLIKHGLEDLGSRKFTLIPLMKSDANFVGKLSVNCIRDAKENSVRVISTGSGKMKCLTSMGENLLVLREDNLIGVYKMECGGLIRYINTNEWIEAGPFGRKSCGSDCNIVACTAIDRNVFVLVSFCRVSHTYEYLHQYYGSKPTIHKKEQCENNYAVLCGQEGTSVIEAVIISDTSVTGMSVTCSNNLLLISKSKVFEYKTDGSLVRVIHLPSSVSMRLNNIVHMNSGRFIASASSGVSIIEDGCVVRCYGGEKGAGDGQLDTPMAMQIDDNGNILLADSGNNRVLMLDARLSHSDTLKLTVDGRGLQEPCFLHLQQSPGRATQLFVGEKNGRILAFSFYLT